MKSIITDLAKEQIRQIAKYIRNEFGKDRHDRFKGRAPDAPTH